VQTSEPINLGTGRETTIRELAEQIRRIVGFEGETIWDASKPDGQPRRFLDVSRARDLMGFEARVALDDGLRHTVESYKAIVAAS
jgi:GDP-L-fucose synthase